MRPCESHHNYYQVSTEYGNQRFIQRIVHNPTILIKQSNFSLFRHKVILILNFKHWTKCEMTKFRSQLIFFLLLQLVLTSVYLFSNIGGKHFFTSFLTLKTYFDNSTKDQYSGVIFKRQSCSRANTAGHVINQSSPCSFCEARDSTDGKWYNFSTTTFRLYAFNAFYDDRPSLLSEPIIRIITVGDKYNAAKLREVYCVLYHTEGIIYVPLQKPLASGPNYGLERLIYGCSVPTGIMPLAVSIKGDIPVRSCMPIEYPVKPSTPRDIAVCVPALYGKIDPYFLIEWLEIQRLLGVSYVAVYDFATEDDGLKVLRHYAETGFVDLRRTEPFKHNPSEDTRRIHAVLLNDCLYRNMYAVKWIVINDVDEFFKPLQHESLKELADYLEKTITLAGPSRPANFKLRNNYFFLNHRPDTNISSHLRLLRYRMRAPVSQPGDRMKPIIHPMACASTFNHWCITVTANYSKRARDEVIDPDIAVNMHYRRCLYSPAQCRIEFNNSRIDNFMLAYKDDFKMNVEKKVQEIMGELPKNWF